jgi:NAD(P)-dependent dehydrogenase (short-subunit alcohol dehydrogenase family)
MTGALAGKVALVTGASRGIGEAAARELARGGAAVIVTSRHEEACAGVAAAIAEETGVTTLGAGCDVSDAAQVEGLIGRVRDGFGRLDILVNNAGVIDPIGPLAEADPAAWQRNILINLVGPYLVTRAALPLLRDARGLIVNISSGAAHRPLEGWSAYCAGKAGLAMLTRSLALELDGTGVTTVGFRPGVVDTEMQVEIRASGINPVSRLTREELSPPGEPARVIAWLAADGAEGLNGEEIDLRDPEVRRSAGLD